MDPSERSLLTSTVRDAIAPANGVTAVDAALSDIGWLEMLEAEPRDAVDIVFTALGRANGSATALDDVLVAALGMRPSPDLAIALPQFGAWHPPGRMEDNRCIVRGLGTARAAGAREMLVVCRAGLDVCAVTIPSASIAATAVQGVDPDAGFHTLRGEHEVSLDTRFDIDAWNAAVAAGRRAVAHQISGACRTMLALAQAHAGERVQFGRPIGAFQAASATASADVFVAVEALDATLVAARDEPGPLTAALAKATAGRTARTVATHCQQVLAGVGFTTDHAFHQFLKRTMTLEGIFGSADELALDIGRQLLASRSVPKLIEL